MHDDAITRRQALGAGLAALALPTAARAADDTSSIGFTLEETAGLRRFGYPVHTLLPEGIGPADRLVLERPGRLVPAQFREVAGPDGRRRVALDFNASPGPLESERYTVRVLGAGATAPVTRGAMRVEHVGPSFRVAHGTTLAFEVPDDLSGFLKGVRNAKLDFLGPRSRGLGLLTAEGAGLARNDVGPKGPGGEALKATVTRDGPIAVGLRFEGPASLRGGKAVRSTADMNFPDSKSWVETSWTVEDPEGLVLAMEVELQLAVEEGPTLVDLGASSTVYGQLRGRGAAREALILTAGPASHAQGPGRPWIVHKKGIGGEAEPYAQAVGAQAPAAEGWAHVMDRTRCTALAVADFGRATRDAIEVEAGGLVRLRRDFRRPGTTPKGPKSLTFWFHFVTMPVQVGAATSPQAMLAPLRVAWDAPAR
jgi:hypothetical protein